MNRRGANMNSSDMNKGENHTVEIDKYEDEDEIIPNTNSIYSHHNSNRHHAHNGKIICEQCSTGLCDLTVPVHKK